MDGHGARMDYVCIRRGRSRSPAPGTGSGAGRHRPRTAAKLATRAHTRGQHLFFVFDDAYLLSSPLSALRKAMTRTRPHQQSIRPNIASVAH
eukprot:scaffold35361_cov129-Isochrysis_galbana.AAC.2